MLLPALNQAWERARRSASITFDRLYPVYTPWSYQALMSYAGVLWAGLASEINIG